MNDTGLVIGIMVVAFVLLIIFFLILPNRNRRQDHRHRRYLGGCDGTRYGCCPDGITSKEDEWGSNCVPERHHHHRHDIGGCRGTRYGCCPDDVTARNRHGTNCNREDFNSNNAQVNEHENENENENEVGVDGYNSVPKLYSLED